MRHRPDAGGRFDHRMVGLLSIVFSVLVGIGGGAASLLLKWPGLQHAGPALHGVAQAHVSLLIFFAAVPASLQGLAAIATPDHVGARRSAFPVLDVIGLGLTVASFASLLAGLGWNSTLTGVLAANLLAMGMVLSASNQIATILIERTVSYRELPFAVWAVLSADALAICAAPVMAASFCWRLGHALQPSVALSGLTAPALGAVLVLMSGMVTDVITVGRRPLSPRLGLTLGLSTLTFFMVWASATIGRVNADPSWTLSGLLLALVTAFEIVWASSLSRSGQWRVFDRATRLFALGFIIVLPVGLLAELLGVGRHEPVSLALVFGLIAGVLRLTPPRQDGSLAGMLAQAQFWLLAAGTLSMLLPVPDALKVVGAAMASCSIVLLVLHIAISIGHVRMRDRRRSHLVKGLPAGEMAP